MSEETDCKFLRTLMDERDLRYQQRYEAQNTAINAAMSAAEKAVTKAEAATEKRFEGVNEFRGALSDASKLYISRVEVEAWRDAARDHQDALSVRIQRMESRSEGFNKSWALASSAIMMLIGIAALALSIINSGAKQ